MLQFANPLLEPFRSQLDLAALINEPRQRDQTNDPHKPCSAVYAFIEDRRECKRHPPLRRGMHATRLIAKGLARRAEDAIRQKETPQIVLRRCFTPKRHRIIRFNHTRAHALRSVTDRRGTRGGWGGRQRLGPRALGAVARSRRRRRIRRRAICFPIIRQRYRKMGFRHGKPITATGHRGPSVQETAEGE